MNKINLNKLYYFYIVAKEGSVKSASEKLHLTQPTISSQIKELEEDLGFDVFIRKHRKLDLNRNGRFVLKKAEKLFAIADELENALPIRGKAERVKINIGAIQSLSNSFIYNFSMKLWQDDSVYIRITQGSQEELMKKMDRGEIDLILSDGNYGKSKKLKSILLGQDKIVAVGPKDLEFNKRKFPKNLEDYHYISFSNQGRLQEDVEYFFDRENIHPEKIGEVDDITLMKVITKHTQSFSILPHRAVKNQLQRGDLKLLGELKELKTGLWAIFPSLSANKLVIRKVLNDYFHRKAKK